MKALGRLKARRWWRAATVGRWRVIEGLRLAESIRKGLARQERARARTPLVR